MKVECHQRDWTGARGKHVVALMKEDSEDDKEGEGRHAGVGQSSPSQQFACQHSGLEPGGGPGQKRTEYWSVDIHADEGVDRTYSEGGGGQNHANKGRRYEEHHQ